MKNWTIIIKGGKIISVDHSCNLGKSTNYICRKSGIINEYFTRHSEIQSLSRIRKTVMKERKINSIKIINFAINANGELKNSKCCLACAKTLRNLGIKNIIYTNEKGNFIKDDIENVLKTAKYSKGSRMLLDK